MKLWEMTLENELEEDAGVAAAEFLLEHTRSGTIRWDSCEVLPPALVKPDGMSVWRYQVEVNLDFTGEIHGKWYLVSFLFDYMLAEMWDDDIIMCINGPFPSKETAVNTELCRDYKVCYPPHEIVKELALAVINATQVYSFPLVRPGWESFFSRSRCEEKDVPNLDFCKQCVELAVTKQFSQFVAMVGNAQTRKLNASDDG